MNINICFIKSGQPINMQAKTDMMFAEVALKYIQKAGINQTTDQPKFIFNSSELCTDSCKSLDELKIRDGARIEVVLGKDIIGANNLNIIKK